MVIKRKYRLGAAIMYAGILGIAFWVMWNLGGRR